MASADSSDSEDEEVNTSNLKNEYDELLTHSYALSAKFKRLKKQFSQLQKEHTLCKQGNFSLARENENVKNQVAQIEISYLKSKVKLLLQDLSTFTNGHDNLLKLVGNN